MLSTFIQIQKENETDPILINTAHIVCVSQDRGITLSNGDTFKVNKLFTDLKGLLVSESKSE